MEQQTLVKQSEADDELIRRRIALTAAVNAHDVEAIKDFIHPSYEATANLGVTWRFQDVVDAARMTFNTARDFTETVEIESVKQDGDARLVTTTRHDNYTLFWFVKKREDTRQVETWKLHDGKWMIVGERLLDQHADLSISRAGSG